MFFRHLEPHGWSLCRRAAGDHGFDQSVTGNLVDSARPPIGIFMDIGDLLPAEHLDTPAGTHQALFQIFAGFFLAVRRKFDDVEAFFLDIQLIEPCNQRWLTEQEYMRTPFGNACRQFQQRLECRLVQLFRIVHQQIHFLASQGQLHHLGQDALDLRLGHIQVLRNLAEDTGSIAGTAGRNHDALHRLLVGAGRQRLAQQGLAAAQRPGDHQHQVAVASQVVQLCQNRLALGGEELEARYAWCERVVAQLVMVEKGLIGVQTGHCAVTTSKLGHDRAVIRRQRGLKNLIGIVVGDHGLA